MLPQAGRLLAAALLTATMAMAATSAPSDDANSPPAREAWRRLAGLDDQTARDKLLTATLEAIGGSPDDVRRLIANDDAYEPFDSGQLERTVRIRDGVKEHDISFTVVVPRGYRADRSWPVLLAAHGTGGNGRDFARMAAMLLGADACKYIIVAPTIPSTKEYLISTKRGLREQVHLRPLDWVTRNFNVDDDRVYVTGYSMGGHCTWNLATMFPRRFAGGVAGAGIPLFEGSPFTVNMYLGNLSALSFWSIWGELDARPPPGIGQMQANRAAAARLAELGNTKFRGTELAGVGHGGCWPKPREFTAFLDGAKRDCMPASFSHAFHLRRHSRGYYLEVVTLAGVPVKMHVIPVRFDPKAPRAEFQRKAEDYFRRVLFSFSAEFDRQANTLAVKLSRVRVVRLYVMDGMFDLSRPVTLKVGTRTWTGRIPVSAWCMLKHYAADRDASAVIVNEVDLYDTGRAVIRFRGVAPSAPMRGSSDAGVDK